MDKLITFVAPVYKRPRSTIVFINSLLAQTANNWKLILVGDGEVENEDEIADYTTAYPQIVYYPRQHHGEYGNAARNYGLSKTKSEWIILSGHDNYYIPETTRIIEKAIQFNNHAVDVIYWDMIHNYFNFKCVETQWKPGQIDIGAFAVRTSLLKEMAKPCLTNDPNADGVLVMKLKQAKKFKIKCCLYVHN